MLTGAESPHHRASAYGTGWCSWPGVRGESRSGWGDVSWGQRLLAKN